ncbi:MAG: hypothetical protein KGN35_03975 [Betaproteobacteria bacterium]|nr:hypothetical protein [Betaproteobacteria bacterium]
MNNICRHCHFLAKEYRTENTGEVYSFSLNQQERELAETKPEEIVSSHYSLKCYMGVWDEGVSGSIQERNQIINHTDRDSGCFFFAYNPSMLFSAAQELEKRIAATKQLKRSNFYTRIGLYIATAALVVNTLLNIFKCST